MNYLVIEKMPAIILHQNCQKLNKFSKASTDDPPLQNFLPHDREMLGIGSKRKEKNLHK